MNSNLPQNLPLHAAVDESGIAAWLHDHPEFFERHADLLASVQLRSPHGNRAVSLQERQLEILRDKNRGLELRLADLLRHGHENDRTLSRMRGWLMAMLAVDDSAALPEAITGGLARAFDLPRVAMRVWQGPHADEVSEPLKIFANGLQLPYCGANTGFEAAGWLDDAEVRSLAMIALRPPGDEAAAADTPLKPPAFGLLVLGAHDARRFHEGMGTAYLEQIGDLTSAALARRLS